MGMIEKIINKFWKQTCLDAIGTPKIDDVFKCQ